MNEPRFAADTQKARGGLAIRDPAVARLVWAAGLVLAAVNLAPGAAHALSLPNKIGMNAPDYLAAQRAYDGWALLGIIVFANLLTTCALSVITRHTRDAFRLVLAALACLVCAQALFWIFTFPANQATSGWTLLPENWRALRQRWEWSHAAGGLLDFAAMALLALASRSSRAGGTHPEHPAA